MKQIVFVAWALLAIATSSFAGVKPEWKQTISHVNTSLRFTFNEVASGDANIVFAVAEPGSVPTVEGSDKQDLVTTIGNLYMFASFGIKGGTSTVEVDSAAAWALDEYQGLAEVDVAKAVAGNGFSTMINFVATHGADEVTFAIVTTSPGTHPAAAGAGIDWRVKSLGNTFAVFDGAVNGPSTIPLVEYVYSTQTNPTWNLIAASLHQ